ncbi:MULTISPECIES: AAA family ATPase [Halomicrobium]|nr:MULTISPECIES: MoxR family ATPase [Halomicrobium]
MVHHSGGDTVEDGAQTCLSVVERIEEAAVVERTVLHEVLSAVLAKGHVLLEDVPGTGKTVTARVLAEALGLEFTRIQFTPDLLPADVTGSNVYNEHEGTFEFSPGPIFANVVLADEINRAPPKTQSALLEAMEEGQVSVDGTTHELPDPFVVVATQNPIEQEGTFRLPEAQRDRFSVKTSLGYPSVDGEMELLDRRAKRRTLAPSVEPVIEEATVRELQDLAEDVSVRVPVRRYIVDIARETRADERSEVGVSPRGVQRVFEAARASAVLAGRDYVVPDDVKRLAVATMAHRVVLSTNATVEGTEAADVVRDALDRVEVPAVSPDAPDSDAGADESAAESPEGSAETTPATEQATNGHEEPSGDVSTDAPAPDSTTTDGDAEPDGSDDDLF